MTVRFDCGALTHSKSECFRTRFWQFIPNVVPVSDLIDRFFRTMDTRMRNATVVVINLKGLATEVIKNIVLAGIGKLVVVDREVVVEEDLGAGFFFTEEDVGKNVSTAHIRQSNAPHFTLKRAESARARIQSLNPLVTVDTLTSFDSLLGAELEKLVKSADLLCVTDLGTEWIVGLN